jgi:hypothetical protein
MCAKAVFFVLRGNHIGVEANGDMYMQNIEWGSKSEDNSGAGVDPSNQSLSVESSRPNEKRVLTCMRAAVYFTSRELCYDDYNHTGSFVSIQLGADYIISLRSQLIQAKISYLR